MTAQTAWSVWVIPCGLFRRSPEFFTQRPLAWSLWLTAALALAAAPNVSADAIVLTNISHIDGPVTVGFPGGSFAQDRYTTADLPDLPLSGAATISDARAIIAGGTTATVSTTLTTDLSASRLVGLVARGWSRKKEQVSNALTSSDGDS